MGDAVRDERATRSRFASSGLLGSSGSTWCSTRWIGATRWSACAGRKAWGSSTRSRGASPSFRERRTTPRSSRRAVSGCDGVLVVLVPRGVHGYSTGTAQAVLDHAPPGARLVFSCGWHITRDGQDVYSWKLKALVKVFGPLARLARFADLDDQVEACRRVFASDTRWTVVRGSDLEEGESQGLPVWSRHVGDPNSREQPHASRGLRPVHGGGTRERRARPRGPGDRRLPDALGARTCRERMNSGWARSGNDA